MKKLTLIIAGALCLTGAVLLTSATPTDMKAPKIGFVDFKKCVEESKLGKQEQGTFEAMKKQMENVLEEKEKTLNDMAVKLNDADQLDLMSPEAETELKRKFRALSQEMGQLQNQYYQALQQSNFKIVQKITETVTKASDLVAKEQGFDVIMNNEAAFFTVPALDVSKQVTAKMDVLFDEDSKAK